MVDKDIDFVFTDKKGNRLEASIVKKDDKLAIWIFGLKLHPTKDTEFYLDYDKVN